MNKRIGQVALVTGAGAGLGRAISKAYAEAGMVVALVDVNEEALEATTDMIKSDVGGSSRSYHADVSKSSEVDGAWDAVVSDFGHLDVVVNNAGLSLVGPTIVDTTDDVWDRSIGVMQSGVFYGMRAAARHMLPRQSGSVINIASIRGFSPNPGRVAYCAAKAAVIMMTRVAAGEWGSYGVRANAIAPGVVRTPMLEAEFSRGVLEEDLYIQTIPAGRLGESDEIANLAVFLSSESATYISGACITIDGGLTSIPAG